MTSRESYERTKRAWEQQGDWNRERKLVERVAELERRVEILERKATVVRSDDR